MATFSRNVTVNWEGPIMEGKGTAKAGSGAFNLPVSFPRRIGDAEGVTSPEELMAAAHAACYAMALNGHVGRKGGAIGRTHITCTVTSDKGEAGIKVMRSHVKVEAHHLTGIAPGDFQAVAEEANQKCPISNAIKGSLTIEIETQVK